MSFLVRWWATGCAAVSALHGRRSYILEILTDQVAAMPLEDVPAWDGDPSSFENFATS